MTDLLGEFDGKTVARTTIAITNAGDGLSEAMKIEPQLLHHGDKVYVLLECEVSKIRFDEVKDTGYLSRVHVLKAGGAVIADASTAEQVKASIAAMTARIEAARDAEEGKRKMFPTPDEMTAEHRAGAHADDLVPGCPDCEAETDAEAAERAAPDVPSIAGRRSRRADG